MMQNEAGVGFRRKISLSLSQPSNHQSRVIPEKCLLSSFSCQRTEKLLFLMILEKAVSRTALSFCKICMLMNLLFISFEFSFSITSYKILTNSFPISLIWKNLPFYLLRFLPLYCDGFFSVSSLFRWMNDSPCPFDIFLWDPCSMGILSNGEPFIWFSLSP